MIDQTRVLLVDGNEVYYQRIRKLLLDIPISEYELDWIADYEKAKWAICSNDFDLVLLDLHFENDRAMELLEETLAEGAATPIVILIEENDMDAGLNALRSGAMDYLVKGHIDDSTFERTIRYSYQRYKSRAIIHKQRQRYLTLFQNSPNAIYIVNDRYELVDCNASFCTLFGYTREELLNQSLGRLFAKAAAFDAFEAREFSENSPKEFEEQLRKKDGTAIQALVIESVITNLEGRIKEVQGIIYDMTLRKHAEKEMRLAEKLSLTGKMARTVAHEIRNPLTNINLSLEQLAEELPDHEAVRFFTEIIQRNANRVNTLVTELLGSARMQEFQLSDTHIEDTLEEALQLCADRIKLQEVNIQLEYAPDSRPLRVDREKITVAWVNIITNAIEAMEGCPRQEILIRTSLLNERMCIHISDSGEGMDEETLDQLFDPFFTNKKTGMGLGMTSVTSIVKGLNGTIEVQSELHKGTTFVVCLPIGRLGA